MPFLANIERCPKFLEYALTMFLYRFADYDLGIFFGKEGATEQECWFLKALMASTFNPWLFHFIISLAMIQNQGKDWGLGWNYDLLLEQVVLYNSNDYDFSNK